MAFARSGAGVGVDHGASVFNPRMVSPMLAAVVFPVQLGKSEIGKRGGGGGGVGAFNTPFLHHTSPPPPTQTCSLGEIAGAVGWPPPTILALQQLLTPIEVGRGTPIHPSKLIIELPQQR